LLRVTYVGHATVLVELDGVRVLTDPVLRGRLGPLRRHGPVPDAASLGRIDAVLVSHAHPDHLDRAAIRTLDVGEVVVPVGLAAGIRRQARNAEVVELRPSQSRSIGAVRVTAVRARHWRWPAAPRVAALGYLIEGSSGVYFAGDTDFYPGMAELGGRVDVALLPVGRWGPHPGPDRLEPASAAHAAKVVGASVAIPIHWGTFYPAGLERVLPRPLREPAARFAAAAARDAPDVEVRVLQPGESTVFDGVRS
jgi:L-ascorbate metabolism protein UlaG (beta-lactamase superfamily)